METSLCSGLQIERTLVITVGEMVGKDRYASEPSTLSRLSQTQRCPRTPMHPALGPLHGGFSSGPRQHRNVSTTMELLDCGK